MGEQADAGIGFHVAGVFGEAADKNHRPALTIERVRDERTERMSGMPSGQGRQDSRPARIQATPGVGAAAHRASFMGAAMLPKRVGLPRANPMHSSRSPGSQ